MYKDPDKQREAQRDWVRQKRAEQGSTKQRPARLAPIPIPCEIKPKRGKDIKCFADLPPDVQHTIDSLSIVDSKICPTVKANRTAIAVNYQHLFPDRFHSTGVAV